MKNNKVKKHRFKAKSTPISHAFDEFNNQISLDEAIILSDRQYYLYPNKQVKLTNRFDGQERGAHWALSKNSTFVDSKGRSYDFSNLKTNESFEHNYFKGLIIDQGFFYYKQNKVFIKNANPEIKIIGSYYRSDVSGNLLDGTPCIVEVIKTSDLSENKLNHINKKQVLTFKIYIDEYGNQISERDYIVGNKEIEQITESIRKGEGKLAELRETNKERRKNAKNTLFNRIQDFREWLEERKDKGFEEIRRLESECNAVKFGEGGEVKVAELRNDSIRGRIEKARVEISEIEPTIGNIESEIEAIEEAEY